MYPFFESIIERTLCVMNTENCRNFKEALQALRPQGVGNVGVKISKAHTAM